MSEAVFVIKYEGKRHDMDIFKKALRALGKAHPAIKVSLQLTTYSGGK